MLPTAETLPHHFANRNADLIGAVHDLAKRADAALALNDLASAFEAAAPITKAITETEAEWERRRKSAKAPYVAAGSAVDAFFKERASKLGDLKRRLQDVTGRYLRARADAERVAREKAAQEAREKAAAAAADFADEKSLDDAIAKEQAATATAARAEAKPADLARTSVGGVTASLRTVVRFEIVDPAALPREFLTPNETAIRKAVLAGRRDIPGVAVTETQEPITR